MSDIIRKMEIDDLAQVLAIDRLSFSLPWPERSFRFEISENPAARCWVLEAEGRVAATMVLWLIVDEAHIATLATHPEFRRRGYGRAILQHALAAAARQGAQRAYLEVRAGNHPAQAMYREFGFYENKRRPNYYKDNGEDAILMTLESINNIERTIKKPLDEMVE